jgi:peptidoglycan hydrolase-like protein with peptidoglycan-binding domain
MNLMKRNLLITCSALVILAGLAAGCSTDTQAAANPLPPATTTVSRTTLVETRAVPGTLGYGETVSISFVGRGTLTWIAPPGSVIERGDPLFRVDEQPVIALFGSVPMYRTLDEGAEGADVRQLQENLAELGYIDFAVNDMYSTDTAEAVRVWQADLGLPETGIVEPGQVVFLPAAVRIAGHAARVGDPIGGGPILSYTGLDRLVTVQLRIADLTLAAEGREVTITVPAQGVVTGEIASIGTVIRDGAVEVTVTITDQEAMGSLTAAPVEVSFVSEARSDVLVVPISALLALAEGGYGVEVVEGNTTRIVPIRTGMFAAGRVEISGEEIAEGMAVGVPIR